MTSIASPPNAPSAPSAALTTPACEHGESTLTPRPRTRVARNRSSRSEGAGHVRPSRAVWCPTDLASYDVTRSILPLTKKKPGEISIHRVMHFVRHDLGALGGCHGRAQKMGDRQDLRGGH